MENSTTQNTAPIKAAFICLFLAWAMAILPIPFVSWWGMFTFNIIAFILAIICMSKNAVKNGGLVLAGTIVGTPVMYFIGLAVMGMIGASALSGAAKDIHRTQMQQSKDMVALSNKAEVDPSGKWEGKFTYPKGMEAQFTMSITTSRGNFSGSLTEADPKTNQPVNSNISGSIKNNRQILFTQDFGAQYPKAKCDADYDAPSKSMSGKCAAAGQSANFTARLL
ncbi:MAG: hypothetical protein ACYC1F_02425 [Gallionellaceae bacterium]